MKLCLTTIYFGKLPSYFEIFYKSCGVNTEINFKFFTDSNIQRTQYPNCEFHQMDRETFAKLTEQRTGITPNLNTFPGYKLCDFRPAYGFLFQDYLSEYDYWGYCDMDMVLGDLNPLLTLLEHEQPDFVSTSTRWTHGPMSVFRNSEKMNHLFMESTDLVRVFSTSTHYAFDENGGKKGLFDRAYAGGLYGSYLDLAPTYYDNTNDIDCFTSVVYRNQQRLKIVNVNVIKDHLAKKDYVRFDSGQLTDSFGKQWWAYHWVIEKKLNQFSYPKWKTIPDAFTVSMYGFFKCRNPYSGLQRLWRNGIGKVKDARDIVWLLRTGNMTDYYVARYTSTNATLLRVLRFVMRAR